MPEARLATISADAQTNYSWYVSNPAYFMFNGSGHHFRLLYGRVTVLYRQSLAFTSADKLLPLRRMTAACTSLLGSSATA